MLTLDTGQAEGSSGGARSGKEDGVGEGEDPPVIDTTSAEVERKEDGSVTKVNEYVIVRDLGQGSSAQVKLCRLVMPPDRTSANLREINAQEMFAHGGRSNGGNDDVGGRNSDGEVPQRRRRRFRASGETRWETQERRLEEEREDEGYDDDSDLYAVKIFDRTGLMRRGGRFARPRARGPDGALLPINAVPENYIKVQREIAIMKKLVHPNIVQLVEVIDAPRERSLYLVMEYVERGAVMRCTESGMGRYECPSSGGCLDAQTAAGYFADIMAGLEYLHLHLIAHRDLKPENVLIGDDGRAKIADFGVSQYFTDDEPRTPKSARSLARSTSRAQMSNTEGTWCFWAPEMCDTRGEGTAFNAYAADTWSAGVTLWCFLYGAVPFFSTDPMDLFTSIARDPAPVPDGADTALRDLLERLLAKDPGERLTVPEARDHEWVLSRSETWYEGDTGGVEEGVDEGAFGGELSGGRSVLCLRGALLAESSFSASFSPGAAQDEGGPLFSTGGDAVVCGGDGDGFGEGDRDRVASGDDAGSRGLRDVSSVRSGDVFGGDSVHSGGGPRGMRGGEAASAGRRRSAYAARRAASSGKRVDVSDADVRAAVTQASGFVLVAAKLKDRMQGMKLKARRLSSDLGGTRVAAAAAAALARGGAGHLKAQERRGRDPRHRQDHRYESSAAAAAASGAASVAVTASSTPLDRGRGRKGCAELLEESTCRSEEREEVELPPQQRERQGQGKEGGAHRLRISSEACVMS
ncbi:unnamed protein product [Scytosiphon promiscuus]